MTAYGTMPAMEQTSFIVKAVAVGAGVGMLVSPSFAATVLFVVSTVYNPSIKLGFISLYLGNIALCLLVVSLAVRIVTERRISFASSKLDGAMLVFAAVMLFCYAYKGQGSSSLKRLLALGLFGAGYLAAKFWCVDKNRFISLFGLVGIGGCFAGAMGVYTFHTAPFRGTVARATGAFGNPNGLANFLIMAIPFSIAVFILEQRPWQRFSSFVGLCGALLGILRSYSRGGLFALISLPLAAATVVGRRKAILMAIIAAFCCTAFLHISLSGSQSTVIDLATYLSRTAHVVRRDRFFLWTVKGAQIEYDSLEWDDIDQDKNIPRSMGARTVIWGQAFESFMSSPLCGVGLGMASFSAIPYDSRTFNNAFNVWLTLLCETGLLGFFALMLVLFRAGQDLYRGIRMAGTRERRVLQAALLAAFTGNLVHCLVEDPLFAIMSNWLFGLVLGMISAAPAVLAYNSSLDDGQNA